MPTQLDKLHSHTWLHGLRQFVSSIAQMMKIAYQSAPKIFLLVISIHVVQGGVPVAVAWITKLIIDTLSLAFAEGKELSLVADLLPLLILQGLLLIATQAMSAAVTYLDEELSRHVREYTAVLLYGHLMTLQGLKYFESSKFQDTFALAADSMQWTPREMIRNISSLIGEVITGLSFLGIIFVLSPVLMILLMVSAMPGFFILLRHRRESYRQGWENNPYLRKSTYLSRVLSLPEYAKELRLFASMQYMLDEYLSVTRTMHNNKRQLDLKEFRSNVFLSIFNIITLTLAYIFVIAEAITTRITLGDVTLYLAALRSFQQALNGLSWAIANLSENALDYTRYLQLLDMEPDLMSLKPTRSVPPLGHQLEVRNVSFRYSDDAPLVLNKLNLVVHAGECLALVGLNGSGKTTLVKLLARFYDPTEGQILWDGIDIRHFDPVELRQQMSAVFQDFVRYDLTARENIGMGDVACIDDSARIQQVARDLEVDKFIQKLPKQYETVLSKWLVIEDKDDGSDLSGGQWQKIAIARAHLRNANLFMLDEPTAALDAEAEHDIFARFAELVNKRTSLLISHRFSTVRMADRIAVIEEGHVTEVGTHLELMSQKGTYHRLYSLQAEKYA